MKDKDDAKEGARDEAKEMQEAKDIDTDKKEAQKEEQKKNSSAKTVLAAVLVIGIIIAAFYYISLSSPQSQKNPYQMRFANETLNFRADLNKAALITAPDDQDIRNAVLSGNVSRVKISYAPDERYNGFYAADSFEISYKLFIIFKYNFGINGYVYAGESGENCMFFEETGKRMCILSEPVPSEDDVKAGNAEAVIFLSASNETSVSLNGNIIYVKGKPDYEQDGKYTGLDMATDRFLLALMKE